MARVNLQIKVGSYVGNGVDSTNITGIGFRPDFVVVKGGANIAHMRTKHMRGDSSAYMASALANASNAIQEILNDGFQVGSGSIANANGTTYYYLAIRGVAGQSYFRTGRYYGDGLDDKTITAFGLNFTPDFVLIKGDTAQVNAFRIAATTGDNSYSLSNNTGGANVIQSLLSNGFQLGTNARVNSSGLEYHLLAMKHIPGVFITGQYTGNGADDRAITGLGFTPDAVLIKNVATTDSGVFRTSGMSGDLSAPLTSSALTTDLVQSLDADGFTVGANSAVNANGNTINYIAFKAGNYNVPISRTAA